MSTTIPQGEGTSWLFSFFFFKFPLSSVRFSNRPSKVMKSLRQHDPVLDLPSSCMLSASLFIYQDRNRSSVVLEKSGERSGREKDQVCHKEVTLTVSLLVDLRLRLQSNPGNERRRMVELRIILPITCAKMSTHGAYTVYRPMHVEDGAGNQCWQSSQHWRYRWGLRTRNSGPAC